MNISLLFISKGKYYFYKEAYKNFTHLSKISMAKKRVSIGNPISPQRRKTYSEITGKRQTCEVQLVNDPRLWVFFNNSAFSTKIKN